MARALDHVLSSWKSQNGLHLRRGLSRVSIAKICERKGMKLPDQLTDLIEKVDGFDPAGDQDERGFSFWPLERMERVDTFNGGLHGFVGAHEYLLFCDYLGWSWAYAVRIEGDAARIGEVVLVGSASKRPVNVSDTFEGFLEEYLKDGAALYCTN